MSRMSPPPIRFDRARIVRRQRTRCLAFLSLILAAIALSSCASSEGAYDGPTGSDAEVALVQTVLDPVALTNGHNIFNKSIAQNDCDCISIEKVDGAAVDSAWIAPKVRVSPGSHAFEVETAHLTRAADRYELGTSAVGKNAGASGSRPTTPDCIERHWLLTFPVMAGATYHIARGGKVGEPPTVYRMGERADVGKMPATHTYRSQAKAITNLLAWYAKQEQLTPEVHSLAYEKDRQPSEWYVPQAEAGTTPEYAPKERVVE